MKVIADYHGKLLNHVEALYRPGEREIAIELAEALGCAVTDTGFKGDGVDTFLAVHPNPDDRNPQNNVFYISQIRPQQQAFEDRLRRLIDEDGEFATLLEKYREEARTKPFGVPHFALRYPSGEAVEEVAARIASLKRKLNDRLHLRIFRPGDSDAAGDDLIQGFLYQDVIVSGSFVMGQLIELQTQPLGAVRAKATRSASI
jgi:hypothetical protein